ncbi:MAG: hypothetical protein GIKADHBN_02063 [Phycisphaerales bacterium]|nr:hypothetical protein [Phycisphaerales bacterium]MCK6476361.1 hypothetical protein [Phycisphaerales bacterium]
MGVNPKFSPKNLLNNLFGSNGDPIAVDFGATGVKLLAVEAGQPPKLDAIGFAPTPPELRADVRKRFTQQFEDLGKMVARLGLRNRKAVCSIPASQTFCKHMQIERAGDIPILTIAQAVTAQQIGCDPSALVYQPIDVGPLPSDATKHEVICTAVSRELVNLIMGAMRHCKLEIAGVHGEFLATIRGFDSITKRAEDATIGSLYLDIGESSTKVIIAQGTRPVFVRFVEIGTGALDQIVMAKRSCSAAEAAALRLEHSATLGEEPAVQPVPEPVVATAAQQTGLGIFALMPQDRRRGGGRQERMLEDAPLPELAEQVEILADEVQMCVRYAESVVPGLKIDRLMCMGGGAADRALCRRVARTLRVQAQVMDPLARLARTSAVPALNVDLSTPHPEWSVAVGLCSCPVAL